MEKLGGQPVDIERSLLQAEDTVVAPEISTYILLPAGSVGWVEHLEYSTASWLNVMGATQKGAAGFYAANFGPVPFAIGKQTQAYDIVKVFCRVQWKSEPANPRGVLAGEVPSFSGLFFVAEDKELSLWQSQAAKQDPLVARLRAFP
jgi:hypothetical protein